VQAAAVAKLQWSFNDFSFCHHTLRENGIEMRDFNEARREAGRSTYP